TNSTDCATSAKLFKGVAHHVDDQLVVVMIDGLSDELCQSIRDHLVSICRGPAAADGVPGWDYKSTVRELHTRLDSKPRNLRVGMIGELLTHLLSPIVVPRLVQASVYFNKEERLHKKGFDLTYLEDDSSCLWYCEVKSGEVLAGTSVATKAVQLLRNASSDLIEKLTTTKRASLWDAAINDAMLVLTNPELGKAKHLLSADSVEAANGANWKRHAILTAGVFDSGRAGTDEIRAALAGTQQLNTGFTKEVWLVIQKSTYQAVLDFFSAEAQI
ncbi:hypothetical protein ACTXJG_17520, partial [Glutamicibacter arilaitensis]|uniref:hypothetical protein n=1 Tax=Glutamicibacter arilaitensis TaxID=256701 RepID=UPI003FD39C42